MIRRKNNNKISTKKIQTMSQNYLQEFKKWISVAGLSEKPHQLKGFKWCIEREIAIKNGIRGGIVADEMGLGKTILMLGLIVSNFKKGGTIIVVPPALLDQWATEIERLFGHTPEIYHGKYLKNVKQRLLDGEQMPVVLTTYGIIMSRKEKDVIFEKKWFRMICDEAHHMRNRKSKIFSKIKHIKSAIKWVSTGTPIQNKALDLLSLCKVIGLHKAMEKTPLMTKEIILHHTLRRTKHKIGIKLPPVEYHHIDVKWLSKKEKNFAADVHAQLNFPNVTKANISNVMSFLGNGFVLPWLTRARQVCILPHMLQTNIRKLINEGVIGEHEDLMNLKTTSKITAIVDKLLERKNNNRRKLVFCHYHGEIDLIQAHLKKNGISTAIIDGRQNTKQKKFITKKVIDGNQFASVCKKWSQIPKSVYDNISQFMAPDVCLCQIKSSSEGLNLQHFQEIYFSSPWWNPALEDQAVARSHRIGQNQKVDVFRFVLENFGENSKSLDQYCLEVQEKKRAIYDKYLHASELKSDPNFSITFNKHSFRFNK